MPTQVPPNGGYFCLISKQDGASTSSRRAATCCPSVSQKCEFSPPPYSLRSKNLFQHVVYTGTRNGSIQCFDKRLASGQKGQELFNGRFKNDNRSVTHLNILHETQMLVSTIRGDVSCLQDLAWTRVVS